jgi:tRNA uridine 5-carboxymethylaminomethyl modification enzyme
VNYAGLMSLEEGKYANPELAAEAAASDDMAKSVIEQIEITAKYAGYIDLQKTEVSALPTTKTSNCPPTWITCRSRP